MDSERTIEKLLRLAAKKRRDECQGPFELHAATRRLLQGEVARQFGSKQRGERGLSGLLAGLWPRFALGVSILAALGAITWVLLPDRHEDVQTLALKHEQAADSAPGEMDKGTAAGALQKEAAGLSKSKTLASEKGLAGSEAAPAAPRQPAPLLSSAPQTVARSQPSGGVAVKGAVDANTPAVQPGIEGRSEPELAIRSRTADAETSTPSESASAALPPSRNDLAAGPAPAAPSAPATLGGSVLQSESKTMTEPATGTAGLASAPQMPLASAVPDPKDKFDASAYKRLAMAPGEKMPTIPSAPLPGGAGSPVQAQQSFKQVTTQTTADRSLQDSQTARRALAAQPVLSAFSVQQSGNRLQVIDADGSVYSGLVQMPAAPGNKPLTRSAPLARSTTEAAGGEQKASAIGIPFLYPFRVTGTNRSLNQKVEFFGNLLPMTNAAANRVVATSEALSSGTAGRLRENAVVLPLSKAQISGKVRVGGREEAIQAVPAP